MKRFHRIGAVAIPMAMLLLLAAPAARAQHGFKLTVQNPLDIDLVNSPVATGVAIPKWIVLFNPSDYLRIMDDQNQPVPAQFKVLSRWKGRRDQVHKRSKWVLVEFPANVPANSSRDYWINIGPAAGGDMWLVELTDKIVLGSGPVTFTISKTQFTIFDEVSVNGNVVTGGPGELVVRDTSLVQQAVVLDSTVIEEVGSVRTVICQRGSLPSLGLHFTARFYFNTHRSDCKLDFRLENKGMYGNTAVTGTPQTVHFEDLKLVMRLNHAGGDVMTSDGPVFSGGGNFGLEQKFGTNGYLDYLAGFECVETVGTQVTTQGNARSDGSIALNGPTGAMAVSIDRFWQNFPKAYGVNGDTIDVALWPAFGNGPLYGGQYGTLTSPNQDPLATDFYRFEGGRWKTHTINFGFKGAGAFSQAEVAARGKEVNTPLMAIGKLDHPFKAFAFGQAIIERRQWLETSHTRYERMQDILVDDNAADHQDALGKIGFPKFRTRGGTYGNQQMYGWESFGDVAWGDGYSNLHYDLPFGFLINFYRTGDRRFFDIGRDMAAHRRDYDQDHSTHPGDTKRGGQMYEKGYWHGNYRFPEPSHTWVHGLLLYHVMTGDEGAREAVEETYGFYARQNVANWSGYWGSRILGWQVEGLMNMYNYLGNQEYLDLAEGGVNRWIQLEAQHGYHGYWPNPGESNPMAKTWMHSIVYDALAKYYLNTYDETVLPTMERMADWFMNHAIHTPPQGAADSFIVGRAYKQATHLEHLHASIHHCWSISNALANAALIFDNDDYYAMAEGLWEGMTRYHQKSSGDYNPVDMSDPNSFSKITWRPQMFPNSETKVLGNIGLWSHGFAAAKALITGTWFYSD